MNTEQERDEFEAFASPRGYDLDMVMLMSKPPKFSRYANPATQDAFEAYQAGRAALQSQDREDADQWFQQLHILIAEFGIACAYSGAVETHMMPKILDHACRIKGDT